jgi:predicted permease
VEITINLPVLAFSAGVAAATGILFGWWPALRLSRAEAGATMQSGARRVAGSASGRRMHHLLIAAQVAFTLLLLAAAGAAGEGFARLMRTPLGYDPHNVLSLTIPLHENSYATWATRAAYFDQLRAKVAEAPGVLETAISSNATPPMNGWSTRLELAGVSSRETPTGVVNMIGSRYFSALKIPLIEGRLWSEVDTRRGAPVAVINQAFAHRYYPNGGAIGRTVRLSHYEEGVAAFVHVPKLSESPLEIVGIVGDAVNDGIANPVKPSVYVPYTLSMGTFTQILVRTAPPPLTLVHAMRGQLAAVNPEQQTLADIEDLETWVRDEPEWQQQRLVAWIFGVFAALALALAVVGLYSVVSYTVARRTAEFGIRMALGAQRGQVMWVVFQSTLTTVAVGIIAGLGLTVLLNSLVGHWVRGSTPDALILLTGTILMTAAAALACLIPAWRAACTDPMQALRCE